MVEAANGGALAIVTMESGLHPYARLGRPGSCRGGLEWETTSGLDAALFAIVSQTLVNDALET
jgi:hypothetical protein